MGQSVTDKTAVVTGAGSGINLEFARLLLQKGANVLFADLSLRPEAKQLVDEYSTGAKARALFQQTDVREWAQLSSMFEIALQRFGRIDIVCAGAGIYEPSWTNFWHPPGSLESKDAVDGDRYALLDINLTHPIRVTQLAISYFLQDPLLEQKNPKTIVHISSIAGQKSGPATPIYVATKHAINGFVRSLAPLEHEHGIRVAAVAPGVILTPLWTDHPEKMKAVSDADEWVLPEEVGEAMLALVEKDSVPESPGQPDSIAIQGGTILEVSKNKLRDVQMYNDPGPGSRSGNTTTSYDKVQEEALEQLKIPGWGRVQMN